MHSDESLPNRSDCLRVLPLLLRARHPHFLPGTISTLPFLPPCAARDTAALISLTVKRESTLALMTPPATKGIISPKAACFCSMLAVSNHLDSQKPRTRIFLKIVIGVYKLAVLPDSAP